MTDDQHEELHHKLVVYAELANGDIYDSYTVSGREIIIYYKPINYLSASTETPYVTGVASPIDFTFNSNTKSHMLTQTYVEANASSFVSSTLIAPTSRSANDLKSFNLLQAMMLLLIALVLRPTILFKLLNCVVTSSVVALVFIACFCNFSCVS